ncbi:tRNA (adenosine(37)-N6)-threonylcarbamoyltransferase complex dimerization subunit type 1 TsaB [Patiriisocius hiemis]|uniref:tRNA (Adenosine(37)-N6)-threonylcarbamoyltransferase complex dimerization subunit type 1 TsaB n=1 Tax=Patiriisocius hiemis TaxID=3075604 RepID=A0ABU2YC29_9FLAO|nr:tRNA (adenosine(37)-N6)-threonylcarbamoyltransferase complex dimerization subunit type 1 TsaB [Constantimarinum sp. W242]MDT0555209.1 tRNA (adenosine(37)-N6)-threonylcarbamoyltransferase complex dimerization subunit type 1 TsaB [Constantimarinum sp. W242]
MATILCLETATTNCSVTLSVNGSVIAFKEDKTPGYSHAENLHVFIEEVLKEASIKKEALDAIAISKGPGSYTGLRIGVSAAKGLCYALSIPLLAIETLDVLAQQVSENVTIVPMLDARRMEVYSAVFNSDKKRIRDTKAEILNEASFSKYLENNKVVFIGDAVAKFERICNHQNASFVEAYPSSLQMVFIAEEKHKISDTEDVAYFEPYYLKDFVGG